MKSIEKQQSNIEELLKLVKENPDLEIVPMVETEVCCGDDFNYWMGSWGSAEIDEVYHLDERIYFRSDDEEELVDNKLDRIMEEEYPKRVYLNGEEYATVYKQAEQFVKDLPWERVIAVQIKTP